jgi:predicted ATPase
MTDKVLGRERELGLIHAFLDRAGEGPAGLVLEGEAGIGKSTLWLGVSEGGIGHRGTVKILQPREIPSDKF